VTLIKVNNKYTPDISSSIIKYYRNNPVIAASHLLKIDGEPLTLAPIQEVLLEDWWFSKFSLSTASRGSGKTFTSAVFVSLKGILYPGSRLGVFAPAFRQSKFIFKEFTRIYQNSPYLQECVAKEPTQLNDHCICTFKTAAHGMNPSSLKALPVGNDGGKIRGERLSCILLDEIPHIPESIFRGAIHPMMSTASNPMQKVKEIERLRQQYGDIEIDLDSVSDNGYVGITSGYYQFNYWWNEMVNFYEKIKKGSTSYSLRFIPYTELPEGFYDAAIVEDAKMNSPKHIFLTEWMAEWIADSEGAFSMSLLESVREPLLIPRPFRDLNLDKGKEFIFGIDVARERDASAIIIVELGYPSKVVHIVELEEIPFPEQSKIILQLVENFNPVRVYMDEYGGGQTLRDHFKDPTAIGLPSHYKLASLDDPATSSGKRILKECNPNPQFLDDANNNTKTLLEQRMIILPAAIHPIEASKKGNVSGIKREVDLVQELINQVASIVVTPTPTGRLHYDLPKTRATVAYNENVKKKDLYSAFILACKCVYDLQWIPAKLQPMIQQGIIKEINMLDRLPLTNSNNSSILSSDRLAGNILSNRRDTSVNIKIPNGGVILSKNVRKRK
jgi:hypothetical protein